MNYGVEGLVTGRTIPQLSVTGLLQAHTCGKISELVAVRLVLVVVTTPRWFFHHNDRNFARLWSQTPEGDNVENRPH